MDSPSSSRSSSPIPNKKGIPATTAAVAASYISQFLRNDDKEVPLFYSTLDDGRQAGGVMDASGDSTHGLGRAELGESLREPRHEGEEESPFNIGASSSRKAEAAQVRRSSAPRLDDSLYSHSEASSMPLAQSPYQANNARQAGWRMHESPASVPRALAVRPASSTSNKASDQDSHFVGQSVLLSSPEHSPAPSDPHEFSRSASDELLSTLATGPQRRSDSPPPKLSRFQSEERYLDDDPHPTLLVQQPEDSSPGIQAHDSSWLAIYLGCVCITGAIAIYAYLFANPPYEISSPNIPTTDDAEVEEAASLLSILPLLTSLTLLSILGAASAIGYMMLVQKGVRRMVYGLLIGGPTMLFVLAFWAWGFSWQEEAQQGSEARWVSLLAVILAAVCVRMTWSRKEKIEKTVRVIELAVSALIAHPAIFGLQLAVLLGHLVLTIPFFSLFSRLLLLHPTNSTSHTLLLTFHVLFTYLWSISIFRGLLKLTIAKTISHWFFSRHEPEPAYPTSTALVMASFDAARGPQLGTVAFSSLLVTVADLLAFILLRLKRWTRPANGLLPNWAACLYLTAPLVALLASFVENISGYALIYSGIKGESFWHSSKKVIGLVRGNGMLKTADYLMVKLLLSMLTFVFSFLAGILGILFARSISSALPEEHHHLHHFFASMLCFSIPYYTVRLCSDMLANCVDTTFICFNLDLATGQNHSNQAKEAFFTSEESPV